MLPLPLMSAGNVYMGPLALIVVGLMLVYGCLRALFTGKGLYPEERRPDVYWAIIFGVFIGLAITAGGAYLLYQMFKW
ncbi:hypothetical protein IT575_08125 [bacterium]|nr:hypothetical protein [bacterium]